MRPIEEIIKASLDELAKITNEVNKEKPEERQKSKLIFPKYRKDEKNNEVIQKVRISEQEARVLFIRELEKEEDKFYYSVETPTSKRYNFSDDSKAPKIIQDKTDGLKSKSASFDLTIYNDKFEREHFVEFKNENVFTIKKDLLKLLCDENNKVNYLIHTIKRKNSGTLPSILKKYAEAINYIFEEIDKKEHTNSTLKIFLFIRNKNKFIQFEEMKIQKIKEDDIKYITHQL